MQYAESSLDRCVLANTRSQWGEDLALLPYLRRAAGWRPGVFVELGAFDGVSFSNTYSLETCYNWTGLLIEANPANFASLSRSGRRATKVHSAVCERRSKVNMTLGGKNMAAQVEALSKMQRRRIWGERAYRTVEVSCSPLSALMAANAGLHAAHFLSLDVEGAEETVLKTIDPACFAVVMVELDGTDRRRDERVHELLSSAGLHYQRHLALKNSAVYLRPKRVVGPAGRARRKRHGVPQTNCGCRCGALAATPHVV